MEAGSARVTTVYALGSNPPRSTLDSKGPVFAANGCAAAALNDAGIPFEFLADAEPTLSSTYAVLERDWQTLTRSVSEDGSLTSLLDLCRVYTLWELAFPRRALEALKVVAAHARTCLVVEEGPLLEWWWPAVGTTCEHLPVEVIFT